MTSITRRVSIAARLVEHLYTRVLPSSRFVQLHAISFLFSRDYYRADVDGPPFLMVRLKITINSPNSDVEFSDPRRCD